MDPSAAADEKRQEAQDLDFLLRALQLQMDSLMTLAKDAAAFTDAGTGKPRKARNGKSKSRRR